MKVLNSAGIWKCVCPSNNKICKALNLMGLPSATARPMFAFPSLIEPRLKTKKKIVIAPISIGAKCDSQTGTLLFSMNIGLQFFILLSPFFPHPAGFDMFLYYSFRCFQLKTIVKRGHRKNNCGDYTGNHFIIRSIKCLTHIPPAAVATSHTIFCIPALQS